MKLIHTADWQIGMTFHRFKEKSRIMMEDDRLEVIEAIGAYANLLGDCGSQFRQL